MQTHTDNVVECPEDLTAAGLTAAIGAGTVADFSVERIGTGQMSECYRARLTYADAGGPDSVVLKVAATDPISRQTGSSLGLYEGEVGFYTDIGPAPARTGRAVLSPGFRRFGRHFRCPARRRQSSARRR